MLVLSRRRGEKVILTVPPDLPRGVEIEVTLLETMSGGKARLGFAAPEIVAIAREEVLPPAGEGEKW